MQNDANSAAEASILNTKRLVVIVLVTVLAFVNLWQFALRRVEKAAAEARLMELTAGPPINGTMHFLPESFGLTGAEQQIVDEFHNLFYDKHEVTWDNSRWMGVPCQQNPNDVWVTQEILNEVRPDIVIETGTYRGGSAVLWSSLLEVINPDAKVITVDIDDYSAPAREHPLFQRRVTFIKGSSTAPEVLDQIKKMAAGKKALVILDSDHSASHVLAELRAYKELVAPGSYIIVQDSNVNGHPVFLKHGPGPMEAIAQFLSESPEFAADRKRERFLFSMHPSGYLRRQG